MKGILWDGRAVEVHGTELTEIPQDPTLRRIAPGLVDIQINGFGGVRNSRFPDTSKHSMLSESTGSRAHCRHSSRTLRKCFLNS